MSEKDLKVEETTEKKAPVKKAPAKKAAAAEKAPAEKKTPAKKAAVAEKAPAEKKAPVKKATVAEEAPAEKKAPAKKAATAKKTAALVVTPKTVKKIVDLDSGKVSIKLTGSLIGSTKRQIASANSLGLRKTGDSVVQPDNAATAGKIVKIKHLVKIIKA